MLKFIGFVQYEGVGRVWSADKLKILCNVENDDGIQQNIMMDVNILISNGINVEESPVRCTNSPSIVQDDEHSFVDNTKDAFIWNKNLVTLLIETRIEMDTSFQGNKFKKNVLWMKVAEKLNTSFPNYAPVSADKCDSKWRNLWVTYKANVKKSHLSGRDSVTWEYYDVLDEQFGKKPNVRPPPSTLISTLNSSYTSNEDDHHLESLDNTLDKSPGQFDNITNNNITVRETRQENYKRLNTGYGMANYINLKKKEIEYQNEIQKKLLHLKEREVDALCTMSQALKTMADKASNI
ncbi:uncharacterized protein LOC126554719 [Aphis gossypii]|uniref:uncharacterized protein LOC126553008 n=1 Tax=Aphis gossypii TaxID=80765 RepID=UPI002158FAA3|nr:uncharacterized protein LOC126553008 [Aphis gossypii]XP_050065722.1 uncharacterized protein LOC126554719 [Aphis gossypii]